jgi:hypothetical protein
MKCRQSQKLRGDMQTSDLDELAEIEMAKIGKAVEASLDAWRWNRDAEVKDFPPEVQKYLLKDWEPGKL